MKIIVLVILLIVPLSIKNSAIINQKVDIDVINKLIWEQMIKSITLIESRNDDHAFNSSSGALGRFQMKKIYVDEVNRILKLRKQKKRYRYKDRTNPKRAREMFDIYQSHHNPTKNIDRAIILHRGKKSLKYIEAVKKNIQQLLLHQNKRGTFTTSK